jgi:3'-phosphoadenosine 5'-phosphosulfate (PAPS) 3'-phosphatase
MELPVEGETSKVNLLDLSASCLSSAIVAADQITALASTTTSDADGDNGNVENKKNARLKIDGSFVTDADMAAQQIIVDALHKVSSGIRIVGEENEEEMRSRAITGHERRLDAISRLAREEILIRYDRERQNIRGSGSGDASLPLAQRRKADAPPTDEAENSSCAEENDSTSNDIDVTKEFEIDTDRVSVFIDPLDATNSYAKGDHDPVSILVAIILDQTPCFGVICKPFGYPEGTSVLDTGCMAVYGGTLLGGAYIAGGNVIENRASETTESVEGRKELPRAVISQSRSHGIVQNFVTHLGERGFIHPEPLLVSGAGEKSLRIITGFENEGLWFYPKGGTSLWDVAASDALLRATGGKLTDKYGNDMDYSKSRTEAENENGVIACYDQRLHADCMRLFLEGSWEDA